MRRSNRNAALAVSALLLSCLVPAAPAAAEPRAIFNESQLRLSVDELASADVPKGLDSATAAALRNVSLRLRQDKGEIEGTLRTGLGEVSFHSYTVGAGLVHVEYDVADRGRFELAVDNDQRTAEPSYPKGLRITNADRFLFRSLAFVLERKIGVDVPEAAALVRGANLWGAHPLSPVQFGRIAAPDVKSWTNLCGITSATLYHDGSGHGLIGENLATGPNASNCRSRCGAGCNAILGTSAWTVDCGEHDRCEQHHSCCVSCQDEFNSASDDYLFASNCRLSGW